MAILRLSLKFLVFLTFFRYLRCDYGNTPADDIIDDLVKLIMDFQVFFQGVFG